MKVAHRATYLCIMTLYTGLSMIAEIGGYVGLFLGVSIIQINHVFDRAIKMVFGTLPKTGINIV